MNTEIETLKQEFEGIQNTLLPKKELEDAMVTTNAEEWVQFIEKYSKTHPLASNYICDYTIVKNATAFALAPVFSYMGKVYATESKFFTSLKEIKEFLENKNYILYVVHCVIGSVVQEDLTPDIPKVSEIRFIFRGYILNDT